MDIEINGVEFLNDEERKITSELLNRYYPRIKRKVKNIKLKISIKKYNKGGKEKYSINVEAILGATFSVNASDWNLNRALHEVLNKMINRIEHKLHLD